MNDQTMKEVAVYEAKTRLSEMLYEVEQGQQFTITRRGSPVAYLVAAKPAVQPVVDAEQCKAQRVAAAFAALEQLSAGVTLDIPLAQAIADGRD